MTVKKKKPNRNSRWKQGYIDIALCEKYIGAGPIIYRSSWEYKFAMYCEQNNIIEKWNSEGLSIRYRNAVDGKIHTYYPDFYIKLTTGKEYIIEIKPKHELLRPNPPRIQTIKSLESYYKALKSYKMNLSKWKYAKNYAKNRGAIFVIVTEDFFKNSRFSFV